MANEKRLIDASPVYEDLRKSYEELQNIRDTLTQHEDIQICNGQLATYKEAMQCIKDAPTVDAVEVVHGRWEYWAGGLQRCSVCGYEYTDYIECHDYCGNCGAKMDGDSNG